MDWSANGWTIIALIVAVLGAAFSGGVFWLIDRYKARLEQEPAIRDKAARALTAAGPLSDYLRTLEAALVTLTGWMGRRARLTHGSRPPKKDIKGDGSAAEKWPRATPANFGMSGLREDQAMFEGPLNQTTLHAITMQLRVWRPLYYTVAFSVVALALVQYAPPLFETVTGPLPELLLWIANNGDWSTVQACFPQAAPAPPLHWPWS